MNILYHIRNWLGNRFFSSLGHSNGSQSEPRGIILRHGILVGIYEDGKIRAITADEYMDLYRKVSPGTDPGGGEGD